MRITDKYGRVLTLKEIILKVRTRIISYFEDFVLLILSIVTWIPIHSIRKIIFKLFGIKITWQSTIHVGCRFYRPSGIYIGTDTVIGDRCFLDGRDLIQIGNHVDIASQVLIYNSEHNIHSPDFEPISAPVVIEDYVFIGPRVIILPGVTIAKGAVVAAGAVVTKNIPPNEVWGGVPAHKISTRKITTFSYRLGRPRLFQ